MLTDVGRRGLFIHRSMQLGNSPAISRDVLIGTLVQPVLTASWEKALHGQPTVLVSAGETTSKCRALPRLARSARSSWWRDPLAGKCDHGSAGGMGSKSMLKSPTTRHSTPLGFAWKISRTCCRVYGTSSPKSPWKPMMKSCLESLTWRRRPETLPRHFRHRIIEEVEEGISHMSEREPGPGQYRKTWNPGT